MMESLNSRIVERGYAFIQTYRPDVGGEEAAISLGHLLPLEIGKPISDLVPMAKEASTPNTYSGIYGLQKFPFHTDLAHWRLPPRYLMLRCVVGFAEVPTLLADGLKLIGEVGQGILGRALVQPRRPTKGKLPLLRIYQPNNGAGLLRWDEVFLRPASKIGKSGIALFQQALDSCAPLPVALTSPGDTLIIDNWRMLHARALIPVGCETRKLVRAYLETLD